MSGQICEIQHEISQQIGRLIDVQANLECLANVHEVSPQSGLPLVIEAVSSIVQEIERASMRLTDRDEVQS